jgi:carbon storage regulator
MLVLTRKLMERLYIGDDICVTVVRLEGGQVRLGIEAPREISVLRAELKAKRHDEPGVAEGPDAADGGRRIDPERVTVPTVADREIGTRRRAPFR